MNDIFSDKLYLKQINKNYDYLIGLIHSNYKPLALTSDQSVEINEEFLREFNGSDCNKQIQLLANIKNSNELWIFLSLNPTDYICQTFLEEFSRLISNSLLIKQYLCKYIQRFTLTLKYIFLFSLSCGRFSIDPWCFI
jgi:hypothetical protein